VATGEHDLAFKASRVREFIQEHHKVLVSMRLSGREKAHTGLAMEQLQAFLKRFEDVAQVERPPGWEGSGRLSALLKPK
jgi:translation initiation factor IF-3